MLEEHPIPPQFLYLVIAGRGIQRDVGHGTWLERVWRQIRDGEAFIGVPRANYVMLEAALREYERAAVPATTSLELSVVDAVRRLIRARDDLKGWPLWIRRLRDGPGIVGISLPEGLRLHLRIEAWMGAVGEH